MRYIENAAEKSALNLEKNALIVSIFGLNFPL